MMLRLEWGLGKSGKLSQNYMDLRMGKVHDEDLE